MTLSTSRAHCNNPKLGNKGSKSCNHPKDIQLSVLLSGYSRWLVLSNVFCDDCEVWGFGCKITKVAEDPKQTTPKQVSYYDMAKVTYGPGTLAQRR